MLAASRAVHAPRLITTSKGEPLEACTSSSPEASRLSPRRANTNRAASTSVIALFGAQDRQSRVLASPVGL